MTYWEETIPADANPGPLVHTALATKLLAQGWTLEDTVVISTRTHKVYKSAAAGNTYNLDWYLDISYPTTGVATGVFLAPFEGYTAASDVGLRGPYSATNTVLDATTYSRFGATTAALEANWVNTSAYTSLDTPLSTSAFVINASVTRDRVILMASTEPTQVSYTGFFTPTSAHASHAGAALFPLVMTRLSGGSDRTSSGSTGSVSAAFTRIPKASTVQWSSHALVSPNTGRMNGRVGGSASEFDDQITAAPFLVGMGGVAFVGASAAHIGELDGVKCAWADAAVARGDTVTVSGVTHTASTVLSSATILMAQV